MLNDRQIKFCQNLVSGMTQEQAYIEAGYSKKTARQSSSDLLKNPNISEHLEKLRGKTENSRIKEASEVAEDLSDLLDDAKKEKDFSGFVQLANRLAKMRGHDEPERHKLEFEITIGGDGNNEDAES